MPIIKLATKDDIYEIKTALDAIAITKTDYETPRVRNSYATTVDLVAGTSPLSNGTICYVYE